MKYLFPLLFVFFLAACGGGSTESQNENVQTTPMGVSIPVMKTDKARKARLRFDLTEVIRKKDRVSFVILVSNNNDAGQIQYYKSEMALTDGNGYIFKPTAASIENKNQFADDALVDVAEDAKIKTLIEFEDLRDDTEVGQLFFKGEIFREGKKNRPFEAKFKDIPLKGK